MLASAQRRTLRASGRADQPDTRSTVWLRRIAAAALSGAGTVHLLLTPQHFAEQPLYGYFFAASAIVQLAIAQLLVLRPTMSVYRVGAYSSLGLIALWIVTRFVAPPLGESAEPVTAWGVVAKGLELTALVVLVTLLPASGQRTGAAGLPGAAPRLAVGWALAAGMGFAVLFLLASASLVYVPAALDAPAITVDPWEGPSLVRPWVEGALTAHVYVHAPWSVLVFAPLAGALLAVATGLSIGLARVSAAAGRVELIAALPAFVAVPSCCGAPLAAFVGASLLPVLVAATPWLLLMTAASLAVVDVALYRRWRSVAGASISCSI